MTGQDEEYLVTLEERLDWLRRRSVSFRILESGKTQMTWESIWATHTLEDDSPNKCIGAAIAQGTS